ncbi:MAG: hypothetical protein V3V35_04990 [Dehalococcoidia bacterium]
MTFGLFLCRELPHISAGHCLTGCAETRSPENFEPLLATFAVRPLRARPPPAPGLLALLFALAVDCWAER